MRADAHTVDVAESLTQLAHFFALYRVRRLPVTQDGKMVGIVSRRDLLRYALQHDDPIVDSHHPWMASADDGFSA